MNLESLVLGLFVGGIVGGLVSYLWMKNKVISKTSSSQNTEFELKALLAEQAKNHINISRSSLEQMKREVTKMLDNIEDFEQNLNTKPSPNNNDSFFGEHATVFLRNTDIRKEQSELADSTDDQPKDFAYTGSGVFVGSSLGDDAEKSEKPDK